MWQRQSSGGCTGKKKRDEFTSCGLKKRVIWEPEEYCGAVAEEERVLLNENINNSRAFSERAVITRDLGRFTLKGKREGKNGRENRERHKKRKEKTGCGFKEKVYSADKA